MILLGYNPVHYTKAVFWDFGLSWKFSDHLFYSVYWILFGLVPLRSKTTCLIRPLLNAPVGFTFILTCVERPPVIPSQRPPCLVKSNTKLPVLKDHFHIWTVAKRFSHKCHVIYTWTVNAAHAQIPWPLSCICVQIPWPLSCKVHICTNSMTFELQTICRESFIVVCNGYWL